MNVENTLDDEHNKENEDGNPGQISNLIDHENDAHNDLAGIRASPTAMYHERSRDDVHDEDGEGLQCIGIGTHNVHQLTGRGLALGSGGQLQSLPVDGFGGHGLHLDT